MVEKRVSALTYRTPGKHEAEPSFLRSSAASKNIAPTTYDTLGSFKKTQARKPSFCGYKSSGDSFADQAIKKGKKTPGAGHYGIKEIDRGYKATTLGMSRGWK